MKSRDLLNSLTDYCVSNPDERFWQALRNWSGQAFIKAVKSGSDYDLAHPQDTFFWDARNGLRRSVDAEG